MGSILIFNSNFRSLSFPATFSDIILFSQQFFLCLITKAYFLLEEITDDQKRARSKTCKVSLRLSCPVKTQPITCRVQCAPLCFWTLSPILSFHYTTSHCVLSTVRSSLQKQAPSVFLYPPGMTLAHLSGMTTPFQNPSEKLLSLPCFIWWH